MKTDKEYPATHSMETSWFAIDTEGNVAIVEFGDDGPVPDFVGYQENCFADLVFSTMAGEESGTIPCMNFTDEQIDTMLSYSKPVHEIECSYGKNYFFDGIIEIDGAYKQEIENIMLAHKEKEGYAFCRLSPNRLLYYSDCDFGKYLSVMRHVKQFYEFYIDGDDEINYTPFFFYKQEWQTDPVVKKFAPVHPFTNKQLSQAIEDKAIKLPVSFKDSKFLQFVKYYGFEIWGDNLSFHTIDDMQYFPMKDENNVLILYGTKHEKPIEPSEIEKMLERGEIDWERITYSYYKLEKKNGQISYKSHTGDLVTASTVWQQMKNIFEKIANAPLED